MFLIDRFTSTLLSSVACVGQFNSYFTMTPIYLDRSAPSCDLKQTNHTPVVVIMYKKIRRYEDSQSYTLKNTEGSLLSDLLPKRLHELSA